MFNLDKFIADNVTMRSESMFLCDIDRFHEKLTEKILGKTVLVIGGAGSIGSSFIKAILPFRPASLVVVDINENALAELTRDIRSTPGILVPDEYVTYPMDFNSNVFEKMFRGHNGFDIVGNFSAHKHVRSEKDVYSVEALLQNNVIHAKRLLDLLSEFPPEEYFCVSTDKAANPVNIMGASKRIMEDLIFSYSDKFPVKTARFANVAFSNGSLPDGFISRMKKLQPISAPLDVKRYFVSPEESGQICMLSCMLGNNREIFFPKLEDSKMMRFDTIAEAFVRAHGYEVSYCNSESEAIDQSRNLREEGKKYPVYFSKSDTSGEKLYEEFFTDVERIDMSRFTSLGVIVDKELPDMDKIISLVDRLDKAFENGGELSKEDVVSIISGYLPEFKHVETGKSLDEKM